MCDYGAWQQSIKGDKWRTKFRNSTNVVQKKPEDLQAPDSPIEAAAERTGALLNERLLVGEAPFKRRPSLRGVQLFFRCFTKFAQRSALS